ncbi:MAG: exosortase N [Saprospiraceae bacterium]
MNLTELFVVDGAFALTVATAGLAMYTRGRGLGRFALPFSLVVLLCYTAVPTRSVLSFGVSLLVVGLVYQWRPFRSAVPLACALLVNPFLRYFDALAGFELRLWLTEMVGKMLLLVGQEVEVVGNVIWMSGEPFSVDAECVGIYLMLTALAVSSLCLALAEYQAKATFKLPLIASVVGFSFATVVAANLMRILTLVVTGWGPAHVMHGTVGLLAFAGYVLIPLAFGTRWLVKRSWAVAPLVQSREKREDPHRRGELSPKPSKPIPRGPWRLARMAIIPFLAVGLVLFQAHREVHVETVASPLFGQQPKVRANGVLGYSFSDAIVYVKPVPAFYHAEHSPTICWRGSGYQFAQIERTTLTEGGEVYTARLVRNDAILHTAWWMDNGDVQTLNQGEWRRRMAIGEAPFRLINVTAESSEALACRVGELYGEIVF